ncbi:MAG: hypothetical protein DPW09_30505 [Anaerolineae bacterium]|nr:hypothetical protein [Anaerolineae bacterium]
MRRCSARGRALLLGKLDLLSLENKTDLGSGPGQGERGINDRNYAIMSFRATKEREIFSKLLLSDEALGISPFGRNDMLRPTA